MPVPACKRPVTAAAPPPLPLAADALRPCCCSPRPTASAAAPKKPCPKNFEPVCAKDGVVYGNACVAEAAGHKVAFACAGRKDCEAACAKAHKPAKPCPLNYEPVCGRNGKVYGNACAAEAERKKIAFACDGRKDCEADCAAAANKGCPCRDGGYGRRARAVCAKSGAVYSSTCLLVRRGACSLMPAGLPVLPAWLLPLPACLMLPPSCALPLQAAQPCLPAIAVAACEGPGTSVADLRLPAASRPRLLPPLPQKCARATKRFSCRGRKDCTDDCKAEAASCACPLNYEPWCGRDGTVHANKCVANCLSTARFACNGDEKACKGRCRRAAGL